MACSVAGSREVEPTEVKCKGKSFLFTEYGIEVDRCMMFFSLLEQEWTFTTFSSKSLFPEWRNANKGTLGMMPALFSSNVQPRVEKPLLLFLLYFLLLLFLLLSRVVFDTGVAPKS